MRATAAAVILVLIAAACAEPSEEEAPVATAAVASTAAVTVATTPTPTATSAPAVETTTTLAPASTVLAAPAPWGTEPLAADAVPQVLTAQWQNADNRQQCSALYPSFVALEAAEARSAIFGGGWAVAWDLPDGPGRFADGNYCADCGRGAFGVAGVGLRADGDEDENWPNRLVWDDGSKAGYGYEGFGDGSAGEPHLMYLLAAGEGCLYNVWSFLGESHLLDLVAGLRFVAGLRGEPTVWRNQLPPPEIVELGAAAWQAEGELTEADISELYVLEWVGEAQAPESCPMLAYADLGPEASDAVIRRANSAGEMLLAWDRPAGPGHDASGEACADCGRGAVGLGTFLGGAIGDRPVTRVWSDGSRAATFAGFYGAEAFLEPAGFSCVYWLWSHLGPDHLDYLFTQLRRVDGFP